VASALSFCEDIFMFIAFFESFKYIGHTWPVALLRMYVGYFFFNAGMTKVQHNFLSNPVLQTQIQTWLAAGPHNEHYVAFLNNTVLTHWQVFSYLVVTGEILIGLSYILGFMVRPAALIAIFLNLNFMLAAPPETVALNKIFIAINAMFFLISAGRGLGFDYYFFKKVRGFWW
jgi:thiosulfate dehydrogenase (quinone) large subunit